MDTRYIVAAKENTVANLPEALVTSDMAKAFFHSPEYVAFPGFCDVHVHFREPGFSYKETIRTGSLAAARGGYTAVCTMPNLKPVPDSVENLKLQTDIIDRDAVIRVYPYASITKMEMGLELVDMDGDLEIVGSVSGYDVKASAVTANEQAATSRLTVTVKVSFTNRKYPEDDFPDKSFSAYADFDAMQSLDAVEATLCEEIVEQLCEDIFNATVARW